MNQDYETGFALSDSVNKSCVKGPLAEKSQLRHFRLAIKPRYLGNHASQLKRYYGSLSGSHARSFRIRHENRLKRPLVEKSRWRHIRLAIKPCYLGNHASQIKSYYGTLSGSRGSSFRIRHGKSSEAPSGGGLTMTSYPVGNKSSLCRKPFLATKKMLWITNRKSWSLFQNSSWKNRLKRPLAAKSWWCHIRFEIKPRYLGNHASQIKSHYGSLTWSLGRIVNFIKNSKY